MAIRKVGNLFWETKGSLTEYQMVGNNRISIIFNGKDWRFKNDPRVGFKSLVNISECVEQAIKQLEQALES